MSELPSSWTSCCLDDLFQEIKNGTTQKQNKDGVGYSVSRIETIQKARFDLTRIQHIADVGLDFIAANKYEIGDIAFSHINSLEHVGKTAIYEGVPADFIHGMNLLRLRPKEPLLPKYLFYQLNTKSVREAIRERVGHAVNQVSINQTNLRGVPMVLAPLNEQKRIVAKLDELLPKVEACKQRLQTIPTILYKAQRSLLIEALSGRMLYPDLEEGECPNGWQNVELGDVISILSGKAFEKSEYSHSGARLLQIANVSFGQVIWDQQHFLPLSYLHSEERFVLKEGDIVIALNRPLLGGKMKVGRVEAIDLPAILYQRVGKVVLKSENSALQDLLFFYFQSPAFISQLEDALSGSDQPFINPPKMLKFKFLIPKEGDIPKVVSNIQRSREIFSQRARHLEQVQDYFTKIENSILQRAFAGALVPQDTTDEPASLLLERIKTSTSSPKNKKATSRRRKAEKEPQSLSA